MPMMPLPRCRRRRHRATGGLCLAAVLLGGVTSGDTGQPAPPTTTAGAAATLRVDADLELQLVGEPNRGAPPISASLLLRVTLWAGGRGFVALPGGAPAPVRWTRRGASVTLGPGLVASRNHYQRLEWRTAALRLRDADGDGILDTGDGTIEADITFAPLGDTVQYGRVTSTVVARPDTTRPSVDVVAGGAARNAPVLPVDALVLELSEPLPVAAVMRHLRVRSGVEVLEGRVTPVRAGAGHATDFAFAPAEPLPFGAVLTAAVDGLQDAAGNVASAGQTATVLTDPGSLLINPSFEQDGPGWFRAGKVAFTGQHAGITPASATRQAVLQDDARMVGYLDVSPTATALELSIAGIRDSAAPEIRAFVTVRSRAVSQVVFRLPAGAPAGTTGRRLITVDLLPFRAQRIFLVAETSSGSPWWSGSTLLLDQIQVR